MHQPFHLVSFLLPLTVALLLPRKFGSSPSKHPLSQKSVPLLPRFPQDQKHMFLTVDHFVIISGCFAQLLDPRSNHLTSLPGAENTSQGFSCLDPGAQLALFGGSLEYCSHHSRSPRPPVTITGAINPGPNPIKYVLTAVITVGSR